MDQSILSSRAIIGAYFARMEASEGLSWVDLVSDLFTSDQVVEWYPSVGQVPALREWIGGRQPKGLRELPPVYIVNRHYEAVLEVDARDLRRDKTGQILARVNEFADQSKLHWAGLLSQLIAAADTSISYDGVPFFSTTHSEGESGVQSNSISVDISELTAGYHGIPANPSHEEVQQAVWRGVMQIMGLKDDRGELSNEDARKFLVMVPPHYRYTFEAAFKPELLAALPGNGNPNGLVIDDRPFEFKVASNARLSWADKFAVFRTDGSTKALIRQTETDIAMKTRGEGSEWEFEMGTWQFGIDAWRGAALGHWQRGCLVRMV